MNYWGFEERNSSNKLRFFRGGKSPFLKNFGFQINQVLVNTLLSK